MRGIQAEEKAIALLRSRGHRILHCNLRKGRTQIDIVSEKGARLYVVEVKYRRFRSDIPEELLSWAQRERILVLGNYLMAQKGLQELSFLLVHYYGDYSDPKIFPLNVS